MDLTQFFNDLFALLQDNLLAILAALFAWFR